MSFEDWFLLFASVLLCQEGEWFALRNDTEAEEERVILRLGRCKKKKPKGHAHIPKYS